MLKNMGSLTVILRPFITVMKMKHCTVDLAVNGAFYCAFNCKTANCRFTSKVLYILVVILCQ